MKICSAPGSWGAGVVPSSCTHSPSRFWLLGTETPFLLSELSLRMEAHAPSDHRSHRF